MSTKYIWVMESRFYGGEFREYTEWLVYNISDGKAKFLGHYDRHLFDDDLAKFANDGCKVLGIDEDSVMFGGKTLAEILASADEERWPDDWTEKEIQETLQVIEANPKNTRQYPHPHFPFPM